MLPPKFWHFPKIWHQTRCFEIPTTSKHHLLIGKNKFMVIAMYKFYIFRKLYSGCIIHYIAYTLIWHFPKIWQKTRCFEIPTTFKHHLLIGKNKFVVIAMHKFYIFWKLYSGCIIHFIASNNLTFSKNMTQKMFWNSYNLQTSSTHWQK